MFDYEKTLLIAIPALPLLAALVTAALGKQVLRRQSHWPTVVAIAGSCVLSMLLVLEVGRKAQSAANARAAAGRESAEAAIGYERTVTLWVWVNVKNALVLTPRTATDAGEASPPARRDFYVGVTLRCDPLTAIMLSTVTLISLLAAIYSIGSMHGDPGYWRFFTYISLFVFSMTMLVSASNFALLYVFWQASHYALPALAVIGGFTALLAALIALTQTDLKRILAYSTISQLGYMFLGLGAAFGTTKLLGVTAGMFHLVTHAFLMALLFLGAGSVMHAMGGVTDVRPPIGGTCQCPTEWAGGLKRRMPVTHWTFLIGCLALAGIPPLSGFFSRNLILATVAEHQDQMLYFVLYWAALFTVFLTALSTFRAYFLTFHGPQRIPPQAGDHAHESPRSMTGPLVILAFCTLVVGGLLGLTRGFAGLLKLAPAMAGGAEESVSHGELAILSALIALAGVVSAAILYLGKSTVLEKLTAGLRALGLYRLAREKFFFDETYHLLLVRPLQAIARLGYWADRTVLDGLVDLCGRVPKSIGAVLRPLHNGMIQFYALAMVLGLLVLIAVLLI